VAAYLAAHPYATATELAEARAAGRGTDPHQVSYFDMTVDAVKSVSVLHASWRLAARQARERGKQSQAAALDTRADEIEAALLYAARSAVTWLERHATYTRTGHHSARTGEWRDGAGLVASVFLHHISRDGDPHLHVHIAIWNRVQRADRADGTWRTLDSRSLHNQRLAVAPVADRIVQSNTHVGQGRTVDTANLLVTGTLSRRSQYVGLTRDRESNTAHIVTGNTAPPGQLPYEQASPESVIKEILERDDADLSATEQIRHAQDWTGGTGHLLTLWSAAVRQSLHPQIDEQIKSRFTGSEARRYEREHSRPVLQQRLRTAQLAGHDISAIIGQITAAPMAGARSISSVLHSRLQQLTLPDLGHSVTWAQRTPKHAPAVAHELAAALDQKGPRTRRPAGRQPRAMAGQPARRPGPARLPAAARGLRPPSRSRGYLPGGRRDHRSRPGHRPRTAPRQP
jgi:TrwC relaxase